MNVDRYFSLMILDFIKDIVVFMEILGWIFLLVG